MKKKTFYYKDELNDDFAGTNINQKPLPADYKYFHGPFRNFLAFIVYYIIAFPIVFILQKITFHERIIGRKKLKEARKSGYFVYANHTRMMGDAFMPSIMAAHKKAYIVANPDALSLPFLRRIVEDLGVVPVPSGIVGMKNYYGAIRKHAKKNHVLFIYPEAHVWPLYTGIRPFKDVSFRFPAECMKPVYTATTTFHKKRFGRGVKTKVYIDGPFYPDENLSVKENQMRLRKIAFETMSERSKLSTYSPNEYIKIEEDSPAAA